MTIVDDQGKLFGFINLFDLLLLILIVIVCTFGIMKVVKRYTVKQQFEYYSIAVRATNLDEVIVGSLKKGDVFRHTNGTAFGIIISEPVAQPTQVYVTTPQGALVARAQPKLRDVDFKMIVQVSAGSKEIKYGNQTFKTGATGFLETFLSKYTILVISIHPFNPTESFPNPFLVTPAVETKPAETKEATTPAVDEKKNP